MIERSRIPSRGMPSLEPIDPNLFVELIREPERIFERSLEFQLSVAQDPHTPPEILAILVRGDRTVAEEAGMHVNLAGELTSDWQIEIDKYLEKAELGQNDRLAVELLKIGSFPPESMSRWIPPDKLIAALKNPDVSQRDRSKLLARLSEEFTVEPRLIAAESLETPLTVLEKLVGDIDLAVRLAAKGNPNCPPELRELSDRLVAIASNWDAGAEELAKLGESDWEAVRLAVAQNPATPPAMLTQLAQDRCFEIQLAVAKNPVTPANVLEILVHPETAVRSALAVHLNATEEMLHQLLSTQNSLIKRRENLPNSILQRFFDEREDEPLWRQYQLMRLLMKQPNTPTSILAEMANIDLEAVKAYLASDEYGFLLDAEPKESDLESLDRQVKEKINYLAAIACHRHVSVEILEQLARYPVDRIQLAVAQNSKTPEALRMRLFAEMINRVGSPIHAEITRSPQTPGFILELLAAEALALGVIRSFTPTVSDTLCDRLRNFLLAANSPVLAEFAAKSFLDDFEDDLDYCDNEYLKSWNKFLTSVSDRDRQTIQDLARKVLDDNNFYDALSQADVNWERENIFDSDNQVSETFSLYCLIWLVSSKNKTYGQAKEVIAALLENPSIPADLRDRLRAESQKLPNKSEKEAQDAFFRLSLAFNSALPERERLEYLEQALKVPQTLYIEKLLEKPDIPLSIWERLSQDDIGIVQQLALSRNTPIQILRQAAGRNDTSTLEILAWNPNTPIDVLRDLALDRSKEIREAVLSHPHEDRLGIYRIQLEVEDREKAERADKELTELGSRTAKGDYVLKLQDDRQKLQIARSWQTTALVLAKLAQDSDESVQAAIARNGNTPIAVLDILSTNISASIRSSVAINPRTLANIIEKLLSDPDDKVRVNVAKNENAPPALLRQLAVDASKTVRMAALCNPKIPDDVLATEIDRHPQIAEDILHSCYEYSGRSSRPLPVNLLLSLANSPETITRFRIAQNPNAPESLLQKLALDVEDSVRQSVASNSSASLELLLEMLKREKSIRYGECREKVCFAIVTRENATPEALELAITQPNTSLRSIAAAHPHMSAKGLEWLIFNESNLVVLGKAISHPNMTDEVWNRIIAHPDAKVRELVAKQPNCPTDILDELSLVELFNNANGEIYRSIAANPKTSKVTLERLLASSNPEIRIAIASNPSIPISTLERLAEDRSARVRYAVAQNPRTPDSIRAKLQQRDLIPAFPHRFTSPSLKGLSRIYDPNKDDIADILREYAASENACVRFAALLHPKTPVEVLERAGRSLFWLERYAVAVNPTTPPEIRQLLTQDSNRIVRAVASSHYLS